MCCSSVTVPVITVAPLALVLTSWVNRFLPTSPSSFRQTPPQWGLLPTKPPHLLDSLLAHSYLPIWNGVQDSGRGVCDSGSWEIVINLMWKHGDFILTIHSVVAEFGYPFIKDFFWLDLNYIKKRETRASLMEKSNSSSNQDTLSLQGGTCRKVEIWVYWHKFMWSTGTSLRRKWRIKMVFINFI